MKVNDKSTTGRLPWGRAKRPPQPFQREAAKVQDDQAFYNLAAWRKLSAQVKLDDPYCEPCRANTGRLTLATIADHLIRWQEGGAQLDKHNIMGMCKRCHDRKSGMERHRPILLETVGAHGEMVPKDRAQIFEILKKE